MHMLIVMFYQKADDPFRKKEYIGASEASKYNVAICCMHDYSFVALLTMNLRHQTSHPSHEFLQADRATMIRIK